MSALPRIDAAVVILHYGSPETTMRLYEQLRRSDPETAVLVLDNAAPHPFPGAWKRLDANLYWAGALAYAARAARDAGHTHLWFLNNDILFASKAPHLARALGRLGVLETVVGPVGMASPAFLKSPYHPQMVARPDGQCREVRVMDGVAPIIRLESLEAVGGVDFDGNPFGYGVDLMLSSRMHEAGWKLVVDHQIVVNHRHHTSARAVPGFLEAAAAAEAAYLASRLGSEYRERIAAWKGWTREYDRLGPGGSTRETV